MEYLIVWIACIVIGALIGSTRGRAEFGGICSAILGPLGWIIVLCFPRVAEAGLQCPACLGVVPEGATRCMHCAVEFPGPRLSESTLRRRDWEKAQVESRNIFLKQQELDNAARAERRAKRREKVKQFQTWLFTPY